MSNEDFMAEGGESLKFENIGDTHTGKLLSIGSQNDTDPNGTVKTWPDGNPKKVWMWDLDTADGPATLWVRGNLVKVLREAAKKAGATSQAELIGATVTVKHHALGEATTKGFSPAKLYQAKIALATAEERKKAAEEFDPFADE